MNSQIFLVGILLLPVFISCDNSRIYETNSELSEQLWVHDSLLIFDFEIYQSKQEYNLLANIQYDNDFGYRNLYLTYILSDSTGEEIEKSLINAKLFSDKLGKPLGSSAIGDIYELRTPLLFKYQFPSKGKFRVSFQQYMRVDSLHNLRGMGLRIEKSTTAEK